MTNILTNLNPLAIVIIAVIMSMLVIAFVATFVIKNKYRKIGRDLHNGLNNRRSSYDYEVLNTIIEDYKAAAKLNPNEVNTQAIIEKSFNKIHRGLNLGERFVRQAISLMIVLGLLGTFYGLTLSIRDLVQMLSSSGNSEMLNSMDSIVESLINSVRGMSVAFVTSLFGIAASIVLTIVNVFISIESDKEALMIEIEEYLDNKVALDFARQQAAHQGTLGIQGANDANSVAALGQAMESFSNTIDQKLKFMLDNLADQLLSATKENQSSAEAIQQGMASFNQSIETFSENTRDFSEFNHNLRTNIERMDVTFADLVQDLKVNSKDISKNHQAMENLSKAIDKLSEKL